MQKDNSIKVSVRRIDDSEEASIGVWYIQDIPICGNIEDQKQNGLKIKGETRITEGVYKLGLRYDGGFHNRYLEKFGTDFHKGMLCIYNDSDWKLKCYDGKEFQYVLVHIGNTDDDTEACQLPNFGVDFETFKGTRSMDAYKKLYPILRDMILESEEGFIPIEFIDISIIKQIK